MRSWPGNELNRLEHAPKGDDDRYRKLSVDEGAMKGLFVSLFQGPRDAAEAHHP